MRWSLFALLLIAVLTAGCGGQKIFGSNSNVTIYVSQVPQNDIELIVAPLQGRVSDTDACNADSDGFGCTRDINDVFITYRFQTSSDSSSDPFYVYVNNFGDEPRNTTIDIRVDNDTEVAESLLIPPKTSIFVAKIYRNNAQSQIGG